MPAPVLVVIHERSCFSSCKKWTESIAAFLPLLHDNANLILQIRNKSASAESDFVSLEDKLPSHPRILLNIPSLQQTNYRRHRTENEIGSSGISVSVHSVEMAVKFREQYQFFQFGPIYQPISKAGVGLGLSAIDPFVANRLKVVAVGGITLSNLHQILEKGAFGVGVIGSILNSKKPIETTMKFLHELQLHKNNGL